MSTDISTHPVRVEGRLAGWTAGRILLVVLGSLATLIAAGLVAAGGAVVTLDQSQRGSDGYLMSPTNTFTTSTYALVSERIDTGPNRARSETTMIWLDCLTNDDRLHTYQPVEIFTFS